MAFTSSILRSSVFGNLRVAMGTYTSNAGTTGGDINAGLTSCLFISLQPNGSSDDATQSVVNETLPADGTAITIVSQANEVGYWFAIGT